MRIKISHIIILLAAVVFCGGCSTTKRLMDGQVLYTGVKKMDIASVTGDDVPDYVTSAVSEPLSVKPNNPLYSPYIRTPFPIGLWVYNYFYTEKKTGFDYWIYKRLAKTPVLISSDVKPAQRMDMVGDILDNLGYFGSTSDYEILYRRNTKKARISYNVKVAEPWTYSKVTYPQVCCPVTRRIDSLQATSKIVPGKQYNIDSLTAERVRIANVLRNEAYYYFRPDYLEYLADTTQEHLKVDLRMVLAKGIPEAAKQPYKIGDLNIVLLNSEGGDMDSIYAEGVKVMYEKPLMIRPKILAQSLRIRSGGLSRVDSINTTLNNLTKLGIFRYVNMNVTPLDSIKVGDSLDMRITAEYDTPIEANLEVDFASKSNSFIGPGLAFGIKHKNIFKGGESFGVNLTGSYEWQTGNRSSDANATAINSYEFGINTSLNVPRLLPGFLPVIKNYDAHSTFQIGANLLNRPKFFKMLALDASVSYDFQTSPQSYHNLTLFKLVYNKLLSTTESFDKTMESSPAVAMSFRNQFIPSLSYTYTLDRRYGPSYRNRVIWQSTITEAGNVLYGFYELFGSKGTKNLFGSQFSQFVKATSEIKSYFQVGRKSVLATRFLIGAGYAYGNSKVLPYSEQFYIGGANSIRAFTIRSIGPGSYRPPADDEYGYFDQTGDFKMEANVEFRFPIMGGLNGAVFVDAGNIWLLKNDPDRPGGVFTLKHFGETIALGTGFGLRYDLSFLVLRADLGIGIHTPYKNPDKPGYYNIQKFKDGLGFHLAIGYPF